MKLAGMKHSTDMLRYLQPVTRVDVPKFGEWQQIDHHLKERILNGFKACEGYKEFCDIPNGNVVGRNTRNVFGQCLKTKSLFCTCCQFGTPSTVLEILVSHCKKLFEHQLYEFNSVQSLLNPEFLGELSAEQSVADYGSQSYDWIQLVDRHLSRMHWLAVKSEQERLLREWTNFIIFVNSRESEVSFDLETIERLKSTLYPNEPPKPTNGYFLLRKEHVEQMKQAVMDRVKAFFSTITLAFEIQIEEEYRYNDFGEFWALHELPEPFTPAEQLITQILIAPERQRRQLNACRMYCGFNLRPVIYPTDLTFFTFSHTPKQLSWKAMDEEIEACVMCLEHGKTKRVWWVPFTHDMTWFRRRALEATDLTYTDCLKRLLFEYSFMNGCLVEFLSYDGDDFEPSVFSIKIEVPVNEMQLFIQHTMDVFQEHCVANHIDMQISLKPHFETVVVRATEIDPVSF